MSTTFPNCAAFARAYLATIKERDEDDKIDDFEDVDDGRPKKKTRKAKKQDDEPADDAAAAARFILAADEKRRGEGPTPAPENASAAFIVAVMEKLGR